MSEFAASVAVNGTVGLVCLFVAMYLVDKWAIPSHRVVALGMLMAMAAFCIRAIGAPIIEAALNAKRSQQVDRLTR